MHTTTTLPGRVRAWGLHQGSTDRLFVVDGLVKIVVFDARTGSPSFGRINEFTVSAKNPGLLIVPPNLYHGWKNIGTTEAIIINMPTSMYNHEAPDALVYESQVMSNTEFHLVANAAGFTCENIKGNRWSRGEAELMLRSCRTLKAK